MSIPIRPSLYVGIPTHSGDVTHECTSSLLRLQTQLVPRGVMPYFVFLAGLSIVSVARNVLATEFLRSTCTHLLFIDADVQFPSDVVWRMLAHEEEHHPGIVCAPYPRKSDSVPGLVGDLDLIDGKPVLRDGFARATGAATGCMLISRSVLEILRPDLPVVTGAGATVPFHPFFETLIEVQPDGSRVAFGEDYSFCERWRRAGGEVWIDTHAKLGHTGRKTWVGPTLAEVMGTGGES